MAGWLALRASGYVDRRGKRLLNRPSELQAVGNIYPSESGNDSPFRECFCFAPERNEADCAPVSRLLLMGSPSAVCWRVAKFSVDAVKSRSRWPLSHVGEEVCKRVPSFADAHFAEVVRFLLVIAPRLHRVPRSIRRAARHPGGVLLVLASLIPLCSLAAARFRVTALNVCGDKRSFRAA